MESINHQSALIADSLASHDDRFISARDNLATPRSIEEQEVEQYAEQIESMSNEQITGLLQHPPFVQLCQSVQNTILGKLLECTLQGASFYRNTMKIIRFALQAEIDPHLAILFTNTIHIPDVPMKYLKAILDHPNIRKEVRGTLPSPYAFQPSLAFSLGSRMSCTTR